MSESSPIASPTAGLVRRLAAAARSPKGVRDGAASGVGRCSVPVAVDAWGAVSERCPLPLFHGGGHEIESATAQRARLAGAAAIEPSRVLAAVESLVDWLAPTGGGHADGPVPLRELWIVIDVVEALAANAVLDPSGAATATGGGDDA